MYAGFPYGALRRLPNVLPERHALLAISIGYFARSILCSRYTNPKGEDWLDVVSMCAGGIPLLSRIYHIKKQKENQGESQRQQPSRPYTLALIISVVCELCYVRRHWKSDKLSNGITAVVSLVTLYLK